MEKTITKDAPLANDLNAVFSGRKGRTLKLSAAEAKGIRDILANPQPPTCELKAAWSDYVCYAADNDDSGW